MRDAAPSPTWLVTARDGATFASVLALGALKECWDARRGRFDTGDLAADAAGAALGTWTGVVLRR